MSYWMITAYDVLDVYHLRVSAVDELDGQVLTQIWRTTSTFPHKARSEHDERDVLASIAEELLNHAYEPAEHRNTDEHR